MDVRRAAGTALALWGAWLAMCVVMAILIGALDGLASRAISEVDDWILAALHAVYVPEIREGVAAISWFGKPQVTMPLLIGSAVLLFLTRDRRGAAHVVVTYLGAGNVYLLIAPLLERPRPSFAGVFRVDGWALPSGHVIGIAAVVLPLALAVVRRRPALAVPAIPIAVGAVAVVAATRLYLLQHHPSDVVVALLVTTVWMIVADALLDYGFAGQRRRVAARVAKSTGASGAGDLPAASSSGRVAPAPSWPGRS